MPAPRKRENRDNHFYNVGEQGRKTGIRLEDKGVRDEYGMEPVSGIFSSPEKSATKRSSSVRRTIIESESMDLEDDTIPDLTPGHILRNSRTNLPPPRSRSPMKTALGSSPRRHSSIAPRGQSTDQTSQLGVNRRLDFELDPSLQETPPLSGSGARRGYPRRDIYDVDQPSPIRDQSPVLDESLVQEEIVANEDSGMVNAFAEDSFAGAIEEEDAAAGADNPHIAGDDGLDSEIAEPPEQPAKRVGRKRKSDVLDVGLEVGEPEPRTRKRGANVSDASSERKRKTTQGSATRSRGKASSSRRISGTTADEPSITEASLEDVANAENSSTEPLPKRRGRPTKAPAQPQQGKAPQIEELAARKPRGRRANTKKVDETVFKKPAIISKPKAKDKDKQADTVAPTPGKLVNARGEPLSKQEVDQISTTSTASRFARGRSLSVFRQIAPEDLASNVGRTGRHRLAPIDFWKSEHVEYAKDGSLQAVVKNETQDLIPSKKAGGRLKGRKRSHEADQDDEERLEDWEHNPGIVFGALPGWDPKTETKTEPEFEEAIAWSNAGVVPTDVPSREFKFIKLGNAGDNNFFSWGYIELPKDGIKRTKNSRRMHMVFLVTKGAVEVNVNDNVFTANRHSTWQVPRVALGIARLASNRSLQDVCDTIGSSQQDFPHISV